MPFVPSHSSSTAPEAVVALPPNKAGNSAAKLKHRHIPLGRIAALTVIVVVVALCAWWFLLRPQNNVVPQTAAVTTGDIQLTVLATGVIEASQLVSVGAQVSGRVDKLDVKLGDVVKAGDVLAEINSLDQQSAVDFSNAALVLVQAQLTAEQATLSAAQANLNRYNQMDKEGIVSQSDHDTALATQATAAAQISVINAQIKQAQLNVATAQLNLTRTKITAPIAGTIVSLLVDNGQNVNAVQSSPTIVKLADLTTMIIKAQISEADEPHVKSGQPVSFTILGAPDTPISARLLSIDPAPDSIATESDTATPTTTTAIYYNGLFEVPNTAGTLKIDMTAQVTIVLQSAKGVLLTSSSAIRKSRDGTKAFADVYDPSSRTTTTHTVTLGIDNNVNVQVLSGLNLGDLVVTNGVAPASAAATPSRAGGGQGGAARLAASPLGL